MVTYVHTITMPCMGMVFVSAYFIGVGFLVAYLLARQCEGLQAGKQPSGSSRLFLCLILMPSLEQGGKKIKHVVHCNICGKWGGAHNYLRF